MSASSMAHIDFLPASAEDYDELMSISGGIYNGIDYLPFIYGEWLKQHRRHMFVARSEGKIVGFESFVIVDGGSTAILQGLRVAPWLRGQGLAGTIQRYCFDRLHSDHPKVKSVRLTRGLEPPPSLLKMYKMIHTKAMKSMILPSDRLAEDFKLLEARAADVGQSVSYTVLEPAEVLQLIDGTKIDEDLFPRGLLMQNWLPLSFHRSNLEMLIEMGIVWIHTQSCDSSGSMALPDGNTAGGADGQQTNHETLMSRGSPSKPRSSAGFLSLGTPAYPVPYANASYVFHLDVFGDDPACLRVHVVEQIKRSIQSLPAGSNLICCLYLEKSLRNEVTHLCEGLTPFHVFDDQLILEMDF